MATLYTEWLNQNAYRAYPLKENTPRVSTVGDVTLPNYVVVDFVLTVAGEPDVQIKLAQLAYVGTFLSFVFADATGATVATLALDTAAHTANQAYPLAGQGDYEDARGKIVLGDLSRLATDLGTGVYTFAAEFEPGVVRPDLRGVRSLQIGSLDSLSARIFGNVRLLEGSNIQLTYLPDDNAIRVDAIDKTGLVEACECDPAVTKPPCIRRINGINVEDVQIVGDGKCVEVTVLGNKIQLKDLCSSPCCGCPELEFITTNLELLQSTVKRLEELADTLQSRYQEFITSILTSTRGGG